jgi:hypothetical protein
MKKEPSKVTEAQFLELLKRVLPKTIHDPKLVAKIYKVIETELQTKARATAFEKFCAKVEVPNLEPATVAGVKQQLVTSFDQADVTLKPKAKEQTLAIEVALADGTQFSGEVKVNPNAIVDGDGEQEVALKFIPFPVALPGDAELVWLLAKRENMTHDEAAIALSKLEDDFWATKSGQKLLKDRVEHCFPEFIARVPAGMLNEVGLKRHYKTPEPLKELRVLAPK